MIQTRPVRLHLAYVPVTFLIEEVRSDPVVFWRFTISLWRCIDANGSFSVFWALAGILISLGAVSAQPE